MGKPIDRGGKIFSEDLLAKALRDSGYKNTAYALAELIDNSLQAEATHVEVICFEKRLEVNGRKTKRIGEIGVIDNGYGMDSEELRAALMFGNGTHLDDRSGIGRFGMGLPNATFSQAKRVDVWSWKNGSPNALWTYLDHREILSSQQTVVPEPEHKALPPKWYSLVKHEIKDTGTLVLWSDLDFDRLTWKTASATFKHTGEIVGRVYRKFIHEDIASIRLMAIEHKEITYEDYVKVNDPLYLISPSSTPAPFNNKNMFQKWGEEDEIFEIKENINTYKIYVRFSYATMDTVNATNNLGIQDRGKTGFGKHAARSIGVSLVRAKRELELDPNWAIGYDPRERWWGCEVEFPAELDEIFGVTINKQTATKWAQFAQLDYMALAEEGENTSAAVIERLRDEGDSRGVLLDIAEYIRRQLKHIREVIQKQRKGSRSPQKRHEGPTVEDIATEKIKRRAVDHPTVQDKEEFKEQEKNELKSDLVNIMKYDEEVADDIVNTVWERKLRLIFLENSLDGHAFFKVEEKPGGISEVIINSDHPFYNKLYVTMEINDEIPNTLSTEERLKSALDTLRLMFAAWARYEQESSEKERKRLNDVRQDWGRMVRYFLEENEIGE